MSFNFTVKEFILGNGTPALQFYKRGFNLAGNGTSPSWQDIILSGNTALTLTNALANGLNYVKLFGGTEQRNLPSEYTQVEYLESSGTQYIDTGFKVNTTTSRYETKITPLAVDQIQAVFGARNTDTTSDSENAVVFIISGSGLRFDWAKGNGSATYEPIVSGTEYTIQITGNSYIINGAETTFTTAVSNNLNYNFLIGNFSNGSNTPFTLGFIGKIHYGKLFNNNVLVFNGIPCRRNSDSVLGMYDTVTGTFLTNAGTGTFTAGSDTVPTPDTPMDIVSNNGVVKVSPNLFNKDDTNVSNGYIVNAYLNIAGSKVSNESYNVSVYIPVDGNTKYYYAINGNNTELPGHNAPRIAFYSSNKEYISSSDSIRTGTTFTTPANCSYLRLPIYKEALEYGVQFELGSTPTPYIPYGQIYTDGTTETVEVHGKNLFDKSTASIVAPNTLRSDFIRVVPGVVYSMSTRGASVIIEYDSEQTQLRTLYIGGTTYTPNADSVFAKFNVINTYLNTFQIERGSTATTYEPYFNGGTATAEMLLKVGDYKDTQEVISGSVTRNVCVNVLKGTDNEVYIKNGNRYYYTPPNVLNEGNIRSTNLLCSHFLNSTTGAEGDCFKYSVQIYFYPNMTLCPDATAFKQWLADQYNSGNPVVIAYPLAEPTTETVTAQPLTTQAGTNVVEITQASIDDLGLEVSYKATV